MNGLKIALFASLAVNVLILGAGAAFVAKYKTQSGAAWGASAQADAYGKRGSSRKDGDRRGPVAQKAPPVLLWPLMSQLTREERKALAESVREAHRATGLKRSDIRQLTLALADAVEADPFDAARVQSSLADLRAIMEKRSTVVEAKMLETISSMPLDARKALAQALRNDRRPKRK